MSVDSWMDPVPAVQAMRECLAAGRHAELERRAVEVLGRMPDLSAVWHLLGLSRLTRQQWMGAVEALERAASLSPGDADLLDHLGVAQSYGAQPARAMDSFRRCLLIDPRRVSTLVNLATLHNVHRQYAEGERLAREALALRPGFKAAALCLARALAGQSRAEEALTLLDYMQRQLPDDFDVLAELGKVCKTLGLYARSVDSYARALAIRPQEHELRSSYLFSLSNDERCPPRRLFEAHRDYGLGIEQPLRAGWGGWEQSRDPQRQLTIGFVSGDLRAHVVSYFVEPLFAMLDPSRLQLNAYFTHPRRDAVSDRLQEYFSEWRDVALMPDEAVARRIRDDGVDILIDLSGHTAHSRLGVFARKPAPLQLTMLGYPNTTGLTAIDYRLMSSISAPPGRIDHLFTEHLVTVPVLTSFRHPPDAPDVSPLPALANGHVTFGSFNRIGKIGDQTLSLWTRILEVVPGSRLLIGNVATVAVRESLSVRLAALGAALERIEFRPPAAMNEYLAMHSKVDVLLDSFPYNGGSTNYHALWMGVPVVTLAGPALPSRTGANVLGPAGLGDWIADGEEDYVARAVGAVSDLDALAALRAGLRRRLQGNPVKQPEAAARCFEVALRTIWQRWCEGLPRSRIDITAESVGLRLPDDVETSYRIAAAKGWRDRSGTSE